VLAIGMRFGAEGSLYLTDWITGWNSKDEGRIWKLDTPSTVGSAARKEVLSELRADFRSRPVAGVSSLLRHADMRVRQKAQFELARRGDVHPFLTTARDESAGLGRLHAIWGIAQLARRQPAHASHLVEFLADPDAEVRAQTAKMIGDVRYAAAGAKLVPLLKDSAPRVQFFAAEALGRIAYKPATAALVSMLAGNADRDLYLRHAGSLALASIGDASALGALAQHESRAVRLAAVIALRRMANAGVAHFLSDTDELVVMEAARAINDDGGIEGGLGALAATLGESRFPSEPLLRRAISANLRLGTTEAAERVAAFAADTARPAAVRVEAVSALGVWPAPSPLDRVDGFYLGSAMQQPRDASAARTAVRRMIDALPKGDSTPEMRAAITQAAGQLEIVEAVPTLTAQLKGDPSVEVRLASLRALQALKVKDIDEVMKIALADKDPGVRKAALGILPGLAMTSAAKVQQLTSLIKGGSQAERQGALEVLGTLKTAESRQALGQYLDELQAGRMAPELQVDLVEAVQADAAPPLTARLEAFQKSKGADTLMLALREALRTGGDARRGAGVIFTNPAAECTRCHSFEGTAANVGPNLSKIGATLSRDQLVEALLEPSATIAAGFGTAGVSPMPPYGAILKPKEIRDIVEFLSILKGPGADK
jgi:quinoprotein glucose dehydrogenase